MQTLLRKAIWPLLLVFLGLPARPAYSQIERGSVVFVDFAPEEITIDADSRTTNSAGLHNDDECKISAFGDRFLFTMSGTSSKAGVWNAHDIAREAWKSEVTPDQSAAEMVFAVAQKWIEEIKKAYATREIVDQAEEHNPAGDPILANAAFAASDSSGLALVAVSILYDREQYLADHQIQFRVRGHILAPPTWFAGGYTDIIAEFLDGTSERGMSYMDTLRNQIADQSDSAQRAQIAAKLIEWSVQLQPDNPELGLPADVVQLDKENGVRWIQRKDNCAEK